MNYIKTNHDNLYLLLRQKLNEILRRDIFVFNKGIAFDIDGTLLMDGVYAPSNDYEIFHGVVNFYKYCVSLKLPVFIITARPYFKENVESTHKMLNEMKLPFTKSFFCNHGDNQIICKENFRKLIKNNDFNIVMSIGDNICDIGKYGGLGVLVKLDKNHNCYYVLKE